MTTLQNVDLARGTVQVAEYSATNAALAQLRDKYRYLPDADTTEGYAFIKAGIKELTSLRTALEAARKREKAPHLKAGAIIDAEAKRITDELLQLEEPLKIAKKAVDEREAQLKAERLARLQAKVDALRAYPTQARGKTSAEISELIDRCGEIDTTHDFYELTQEACAAREQALDELGQILADRLAFETAEAQRQTLERQQQEQAEEMQRLRAAMHRQQQELEQARQQLGTAQAKPLHPLTGSRSWRARVLDKSTLIAAIAAGYATEDLLIVDQAALDSLANDKREHLALPGVIAEPISAAA